MEEVTIELLNYGVLGVAPIVLGYVIVKLYNKNQENQEQFISKIDAYNEKYVGVIEKSLSAFTGLKDILVSNNAVQTKEVIKEVDSMIISQTAELKNAMKNR